MNAKKDFKCVIIGDSGVGKTSLLMSYTTKVFQSENVPVLLEDSKADLIIDGKERTLHLWDTTWEQDYTRLCPLWYPCTDVFLACFSIDSPPSFERIEERWIPELRHACPGAPYLIVGTKADLRDDPATARDLKMRKMQPIQNEDGVKMAKVVGATAYVECSARTLGNVDEVFEQALAAAMLPQKSAKKRRSEPSKATRSSGASGQDSPSLPFTYRMMSEDFDTIDSDDLNDDENDDENHSPSQDHPFEPSMYRSATGLIDYGQAKSQVDTWRSQKPQPARDAIIPDGGIWMIIPDGEYHFGRFGFNDARTAARSFLFFTTQTYFTKTSFRGEDQETFRKEEPYEERFSRRLREGYESVE
ncbi:Rho GTPase [Arachnomyces sp. PD_36]|nr:Rho GTPase [Arachnomyces sp. PD_36]